MTVQTRIFRCLWLIVGMAITLVTVAARAQAQVAVEPYVGAYWFDDDALDFAGLRTEFDAGSILGVRGVLPLGERWSIGGGYGYASFTAKFRITTIEEPAGVVVEEDVSEHLYYGLVEYAPVLPDPVGIHLSGALGGATYSPESGESTSDPLAGFGAGLGFRASDRATIRVDLRDHLRFCSQAAIGQEAGLCDEEQVLQNFELSAGVRLRF